jgi:aspartate/glutamate racemase
MGTATSKGTAIMATALEEGRLFLMKTIGLIGGMSWESTVSYLNGAEDCHVPLFDTTRVHALAAVEYALKGDAVR